jgi:hypothetical protein
VSLDDIDDALAEWQLWEQHWESQAMRWEPYWDQPELPDPFAWPLHQHMTDEGVDGYAATALLEGCWGPIDTAGPQLYGFEPTILLMSPEAWDEMSAVWARIAEEMNRAFAQIVADSNAAMQRFFDAFLLEPCPPEPEPTEPLADLARQAVRATVTVPPPVDPDRITRGGQPWHPRPRRRDPEQDRAYRMFLAEERLALSVTSPASTVRISGV